jgi:hypothetical protein
MKKYKLQNDTVWHPILVLGTASSVNEINARPMAVARLSST